MTHLQNELVVEQSSLARNNYGIKWKAFRERLKGMCFDYPASEAQHVQHGSWKATEEWKEL